MARIKTTPKQQPRYYDCINCKQSYDPHSPALDGHMTLVRCRLDGHRSRLICRDGCSEFVRK